MFHIFRRGYHITLGNRLIESTGDKETRRKIEARERFKDE
jgi:hypothetical protein